MRALPLVAAFALAAAADTVIVLNKGASTATVIDRATGETTATLKTGLGPHEVAVSADGKTAVATNYGGRGQPGKTLTVYALPAGTVQKTIDLGVYTRPHGVEFLPRSRRVAVTAEGARALIVVDLDTGKVVQAVKTDQEVSHMVALSPDGARAYVANIGSGSMTAIDLAAGQRLKNLPTGRGAEGIAVTPDGKEIWVTNRGADSVSIVDAEKLEIVATLKCGRFPIRAKFTPDGRHALVSCAFSGEVAVFDARERKEIARINLADPERKEKGNMFRRRGPLPIGILVPPDGKHAYVACGAYDSVARIDTATWKITARHATGREPDGLAYSSE